MSGYFKKLRMEWIWESLLIFGWINRSCLEVKFEISNGQAAVDMKEFLKKHPNYCHYNAKTKRYEIGEDPRLKEGANE